jgi:hypothetical protein
MLDANAAGKNTIHDERSRDGKYFRRRFRMPYTLFKALIKTMLDEQVGSRSSPSRRLILCTKQWYPKYGTSGQGPLDCTGNPGSSLHVRVYLALSSSL